MTIQLSVAVRNARLDAIEIAIGSAPTLAEYNAWLASLPSDDWSGAFPESKSVRWVDGVGFVEVDDDA